MLQEGEELAVNYPTGNRSSSSTDELQAKIAELGKELSSYISRNGVVFNPLKLGYYLETVFTN